MNTIICNEFPPKACVECGCRTFTRDSAMLLQGGKLNRVATASCEDCGILYVNDCQPSATEGYTEDEADYVESYREDQFRDDVEADADTLASAGWGTEEDYGYYGDDEPFGDW